MLALVSLSCSKQAISLPPPPQARGKYSLMPTLFPLPTPCLLKYVFFLGNSYGLSQGIGDGSLWGVGAMEEAQSILIQSANSYSPPRKPSKDASISSPSSSFSQEQGLQWCRISLVRLLRAGWQKSDGTYSVPSLPSTPRHTLQVLLDFLSELVPLGLPLSLLQADNTIFILAALSALILLSRGRKLSLGLQASTRLAARNRLPPASLAPLWLCVCLGLCSRLRRLVAAGALCGQ